MVGCHYHIDLHVSPISQVIIATDRECTIRNSHLALALPFLIKGFSFSLAGNQPCLNLFFKTWTLDSVAKFIGAIIGVFLLAVSVEGLAKFRQYFVRIAGPKSFSASTIRTAVTAMHGIQALLGYALMLATMTYSAEILLAAVFGLATGYAAFFTLDDDLQCSHVAANPCCNYLQEPLLPNASTLIGSVGGDDSTSESSYQLSISEGNDASEDGGRCCYGSTLG